MVTRNRSTQRTEFLNNLLIDAIEGGITSQWATFVDVDRDEELNIKTVTLFDTDQWYDLEKQFMATGTAEDAWSALEWVDQYEKLTRAGLTTYAVTIETMAHGLWVHTKTPAFAEQGDLTLANRTNGEDGGYDAVDADCVLQVGIFGKVIYG